ncbi:hypothetical protein HA402_008377 [Bradysia odoriphaga]|nr:hypothetical protein HA402_008377 [Bradysia odoriphaga]
MGLKLLIFIIGFCSHGIADNSNSLFYFPSDGQSDSDWWQRASFYQIYPRSFQDSNGDGIGDLNGITQRLGYLKEIGIKATWLSPIFKSPMADFGYDVADFYSIQPEYGTMDDFDRLIRKAQEIDLKIILDFVPNHSSDENIWFQNSVNRVKGFEDFYIWHPGFEDPNNSSARLPPTNWISLFQKSAWQYNDERGEFYLHQFTVKQPDLNYRNPSVVKEMKNVLRFWLDRGVSGFRIDAVPHIFEVDKDVDGNYPDEPLSGNTDDPNDWNYLNHIYTKDMPETIDMIYQWREVLDHHKKKHGGESRVMLTESYSPIDIVMKYYGDGKREGSHIPFNFLLIEQINNNSNANDYKSTIDYWMKNMPPNRTPNWVIGNHDQNRVASRFGTDRIDMINMILLTLPGVSITYNGEEIGMVDVWISWNDTVDPAACNTNPSVYEKFSRDPERTPFQWDTTANAGFSTNSKTWLPVASNYKDFNVEVEMTTPKSHLNVYMSLMRARSTRTMKYGKMLTEVFNGKVLVILRQLSGDDSYITVANIGDTTETIDLSNTSKLPDSLQYYCVSVSSDHHPGETVSSRNIVLKPKESFVLKTNVQSHGYEYFKYVVD